MTCVCVAVLDRYTLTGVVAAVIYEPKLYILDFHPTLLEVDSNSVIKLKFTPDTQVYCVAL